MNLKKFSFCVGSALALTTAGNATERPNILFIFTDDHAMKAITAYSEFFKPIGFKTPNIDRIADEGAIFLNNTVCNAISGPSRAAVLTGKHSHKNGFKQNIGNVNLNANQFVFPRELRQSGYQTAIFGKWHLGEDVNPGEFGFSDWEILVHQGNYYNGEFRSKAGKKIEKGYSTDIITDKSLNWLDKRDKDKPFLLMCHYKAPHRTWHPAVRHLNMFDGKEVPIPEDFRWEDSQYPDHLKGVNMRIQGNMFACFDMKFKSNQVPKNWTLNYKNYNIKADHEYFRMDTKDKKIFDEYYKKMNLEWKKLNPQGEEEAKLKYQRYVKDYLKTILSVDENIGRILDYLDKTGLAENTLLVYSSDQSFFLGEKGWYDKRFMYKESFGMPLVMRHPKLIKQKTKIKEATQNIDFAPTFLEVAGCKIPDEVQGLSLLPLFKAGGKLNRDGIYYRFYEADDADHNAPLHYGVFDGNYKLIFFEKANLYELYDTVADFDESKNIYGDGTGDIALKMKKKLEDVKKHYDDI